MAAQTSITLNGVTYTPAGVTGGIATWIYRGDGTPGSFSRLQMSVTPPGPKGLVYRVHFKLSLPIVQATDTSCSCAGTVLRTTNVDHTFLLPVTSTTAERTAVYHTVESLYGVASPSDSGVIYDAIVNLTIPTS